MPIVDTDCPVPGGENSVKLICFKIAELVIFSGRLCQAATTECLKPRLARTWSATANMLKEDDRVP